MVEHQALADGFLGWASKAQGHSVCTLKQDEPRGLKTREVKQAKGGERTWHVPQDLIS